VYKKDLLEDAPDQEVEAEHRRPLKHKKKARKKPILLAAYDRFCMKGDKKSAGSFVRGCFGTKEG